MIIYCETNFHIPMSNKVKTGTCLVHSGISKEERGVIRWNGRRRMHIRVGMFFAKEIKVLLADLRSSQTGVWHVGKKFSKALFLN